MSKPNAEARTDWAKLRATPEAEIEAIAAKDADNPAVSSEDWARTGVALPPRKTSVKQKAGP